MRVGLSVLVVLAMSVVSAPAQVQPERTTAALVLAEGVVYLNDTPVEATTALSVLPDLAVLRTAQGRAAIGLRRDGLLFRDQCTPDRLRKRNQAFEWWTVPLRR